MDTVGITIRKCLFAACCSLSPGVSADSELGIFKTSDDGQTWQSFDSAIAMSEDACVDPEVIPSTSADSTLAIETKLFVANPGSNTNRQTFLRFINPNEDATAVEIYGIDDDGNFSANGAVSFNLDGGAAKQITAQDLENGNAGEGLAGHLCDGQGKWQLHVRSDKTVEVMGLIRTPDGFLTSLTDVVPKVNGVNHVYFANPASNTTKQTFLRIVNTTSESGSVTISGVDDEGTASTGTVAFSLVANEAKQVTIQDLEDGNSGSGLSGALGQGSGKWHLSVTSSLDLEVLSLIRTPTGFLTNLSGVVEENNAGDHVIVFANPASESERATFLRIINTSDTSGFVTLSGIDENGVVAPEGDVQFELNAGAAKQITTSDLEIGNSEKGLTGMLGEGEGRWRLTVSSDLELEVMSLIRTQDGFLTNLSRTAPIDGDGVTHLYFLNPGSNETRRSSLHVANLSDETATLTVTGTDDTGASGGTVTLNIEPSGTADITAQELETGSAEISGSLGDGFGKWHIQVVSDQDIKVQSLLDTSTGFVTNLSRTTEGAQNAAGFFSTNISGTVIQSICIDCHIAEGVAASSALLYIPSDTEGYIDSNFQVLRDYVAAESDNVNNLLDKPRGVNHGGGVQLASDSTEYMNLVQFLQLLNADIEESSNNTSTTFWDGVVIANPKETLRRAALIIAQRLPTDAELADVSSESDLPDAIRGLMHGDGFHDFLTTGANDRLFTDAFFGNLNFDASDLNASVFFPIGATRYYEDVAETDEEEQAKFQWNLRWRWGLARAPLELIAYIVMNDRSYQEIVTADYMMLNYMSGDILNSGVEFDTEDPQVFQPGQNLGQIVRDDQLIAEFETNRGVNISSHGDFIEYPHAGVLNTHAFLNRYPTTETNRNRARARWTYYHFLGVDIEKSAERTTDPEALTDTDNPTMSNPSGTVCHSLHDPVAGTFQNYGNEGFYRDQRGGMDSLPNTYKHPEWFIDDAEPSDYAEGDTWYRDMREPGFEGQLAPDADNSLAWLGSVIADDPRFATAAVKFWWPALIGTEALTPPEASEDNDFHHKLAAFEAQNAFITALGEDFGNGINEGNPYNAKDLLTEIVMSPWFRATALTDAATGTTTVTTAYGTDRLLTPLELERKSRDLLGWTWGAGESIWQFDGVWTNLMDRFRIYYGGINSDGIKERSRALTPLMANVAERQAISMACPAVVIDFDRANSTRLLFSDIEPNATPVLEASQSFDVSADNLDDAETHTLTSHLDAVSVAVNISFTNDYADDESDRNLHLDSLTIRNNQGAEVMSLELEDLDSIDGASAECGNARSNDFVLWSNCSITIPFTPDTAGNYDIEVNAFGDLAGSELPIMEIQIDSEDAESGHTVGASLIKDKLIDLHQKMLGETLTVDSLELEASYQLLVETWQARIAQENNSWAWSWDDERCQFYLEEQWADDGVANRAQDPSGMLNTWTSVLIYFMTDFHYLHE